MSSRIAAILGFTSMLVAAPPAFALGLDLSSLWPNEDVNSWTYQQSYEVFFPDPEVGAQVVRLFLEGTTVVPNGIVTQVLREELVNGATMALAQAPGVTSPLLRNLWQARPDLREAIARFAVTGAAGANPCPNEPPQGSVGALLLNGQLTFRKTADEIAAWRCDVADTRSWLWLTSNLAIGNTFTLQLIPDIVSDVYLRGTIAAVEDVTVSGGTFDSCLRVDYVVDYGLSTCTNESGQSIGTSHAETRGYVHYAPGVGPVQSFEEFIPYLEATGDCAPPEQIGQVSHRITREFTTGTVVIAPTTWGRIKAIYR